MDCESITFFQLIKFTVCVGGMLTNSKVTISASPENGKSCKLRGCFGNSALRTSYKLASAEHRVECVEEIRSFCSGYRGKVRAGTRSTI